jgi:hypothetical protein
MIEIQGKICTITSGSTTEDGRPHAIVETALSTLSKAFCYLEVPSDPRWCLDDRVTIRIELTVDMELRSAQEQQREAREMNFELDQLQRENARYRFPTEENGKKGGS